MKKLFLVILLSLIPVILSAQQAIVSVSANSTLTADDDYVEFVLPIGTPSTETITLTLTGTFVSTNRVDASVFNNNWAAGTFTQSLPVIQASDNSSDTTITIPGTWVIGNVGWQRIRVYATDWTSGTVTVTAVRGFGVVSTGGGGTGGAGDASAANQVLELTELQAINANTLSTSTNITDIIGNVGSFSLLRAAGVVVLDDVTGLPRDTIPGYGLNLPYDLSSFGTVDRWRADNDGQCTPVGGDDYLVAPCTSRGGVLWTALSIGGVPIGARGTALSTIPWGDGTLVSGTTAAMTGTTSTSTVAATALNYLYITSCAVSNSSTTVSTDILLQDGNGGTTLWVLPAPAAAVVTTGGGGATHTFGGAPLKVPTAGNALYTANFTTGSNTKVSCNGYRSTVSY